jgi:hypothetical protein
MEQLAGGRAEAAAAIWDWRASTATDAARDPSPTRRRGLIQGAVGAAVGGGFWMLGWHGVAVAACVIAGVVAAAALLSPGGLYAAIQRLIEATAHAVGVGLSWLLLVPFFYLFFAPFGALFRRGRRDRLCRRYESDAATYWEPHEGQRASSSRLDRQY